MSKKGIQVRFGLVLAGLCFFFNPNVSLFDLFPDMIGALLIYAGLRKAADTDGYFEDARRLSFYMIWLYAFKLILSFSLLRYPDNALPYTFLAGVLEGIFLLTFFGKLYNGFEYTAMRGGEGQTAEAVHNVRTFSYLFVVMRSILTFVPEILDFFVQTDELELKANAAYRMPIDRLKPYLIAVCVFVQLILGVIYLIHTFAFFRTVRKDTLYRSSLMQKYAQEHAVERQHYVRRSLGAGCLLCAAAAVFAVDFSVQGTDILCDLLGAACLLLSFIALKGYDEKGMPALPLLLFFAASAATAVLSSCLMPEVYARLTGVRNALPETSGFLSGNAALPAAIAVSLFYLLCTAYVIWVWIGHQKAIYAAEQFGNHDRKLLTVFVLFTLTALVKGAAFCVNIGMGHLACTDSVAMYVSMRSRLNAADLAAFISGAPDAALFESLDTAAVILRFVTIALAVFTVFNVLALKSQTTGEEQ